MDIRIPSGPPTTPDVSAADGAAAETAASGASGTAGAASADAVRSVAEDLAAGRISRDEAVDRLLADALGGGMVQGAPAEVRAEVAEALRALVETDPHLASLVAGLTRGER